MLAPRPKLALGPIPSWTSAEVSLPLGWQLSGLYRFDELWVALAEGDTFDDYASGFGQYADQALRRMADRLCERRRPATGLRRGRGMVSRE